MILNGEFEGYGRKGAWTVAAFPCEFDEYHKDPTRSEGALYKAERLEFEMQF
jgi:hypothetical protein